MSAGKGDRPRKVDAVKYGENYDAIFRRNRKKKYKCNKCGKVITRDSDKKWMNSICSEKGENSRLYRIDKPL